MIGQTVSHHRIVDKLGAIGIGEVYRAEDTNLNRQVAIKVLPDIPAGDPKRLARCEREAKLLATTRNHSVQHPASCRRINAEIDEGFGSSDHTK